MKKYKIEKYDWENNRLDCLWYDGLVAKIYSDKGEFCIFARGQIRAKLFSKDENGEVIEHAYVKGSGISFYQEMSEYIKNDEELVKIINNEHKTYQLEFDNNNWLEVDLLNNEGEYEELDIVLDSGSLNDAVKEVIKMIPDIEKELEEQGITYGKI